MGDDDGTVVVPNPATRIAAAATEAMLSVTAVAAAAAAAVAVAEDDETAGMVRIENSFTPVSYHTPRPWRPKRPPPPTYIWLHK
jgi:hypothetical protein